MASPSKPIGYECEFVDQVPEDYFCKYCKHVAREPNITSCCGEGLCKACIKCVIQSQESCPCCQEVDFTSYPQKKWQRVVLTLKVHCSLKDRGCEWTGQLQHLDAHLDLTTGDCVYVDVDCPNKCNQNVQKHNVDTHLANHCPNRDYTCPHCSFKATFREVFEHFNVCQYYPLVCPNRCGASFERDVLEDHMKMCGLQKLQCEFSYAGCEDEFVRDHQKEHIEQNTQKHLALVAAATLRNNQEQQKFVKELKDRQDLLEQQLKNKDAQVKEQQKVFEKKLGEQRAEFHQQLAKKDEQIKILELSIKWLRLVIGILPIEFTLPDFSQSKAANCSIFTSPMYTHPEGFKIRLKLLLNGSKSGLHSHLSVEVFLLESIYMYANFNVLPARFTITLGLLNQHRNQDHHTKDIVCNATREAINSTFLCIGSCYRFFPLDSLNWKEDEKTQFLKDNCLKFMFSKVTFLQI